MKFQITLIQYALSRCPCTLVVSCLLAMSVVANGQQAGTDYQQGGHDLQQGMMPPGVIGSQRMMVRSQLIGYMQPIQFVVPKGAQVRIWDGQAFQPIDAEAPSVRLEVGAVYRLEISNIPRRKNRKVYPSIEVLNRLYPPPGQEDRFPVVVHITQEELESAIDGKFVQRVTYLENPETAIPFKQIEGDQNYFRVRPDQDPLRVAAQLGRPMTMVRVGSRVPTASADGRFELGQSPVQWIQKKPTSVAKLTTIQQGMKKENPQSGTQRGLPPVVKSNLPVIVGGNQTQQSNRQRDGINIKR